MRKPFLLFIFINHNKTKWWCFPQTTNTYSSVTWSAVLIFGFGGPAFYSYTTSLSADFDLSKSPVSCQKLFQSLYMWQYQLLKKPLGWLSNNKKTKSKQQETPITVSDGTKSNGSFNRRCGEKEHRSHTSWSQIEITSTHRRQWDTLNQQVNNIPAKCHE